jgi:hypothetical protein
MRWHDYLTGLPQRKKGSRQAAPLQDVFGEDLACLPPLLNISTALPVSLGFAGDIGIPLVDLLLSFLASNAVSFLYLPDQLIALTIDDVDIVIRQYPNAP